MPTRFDQFERERDQADQPHFEGYTGYVSRADSSDRGAIQGRLPPSTQDRQQVRPQTSPQELQAIGRAASVVPPVNQGAINPRDLLGVNPDIVRMQQIADMNALARQGTGRGAQGPSVGTAGRRRGSPSGAFDLGEAVENVNVIMGVGGRDPSTARPMSNTEWEEVKPYLQASPQGNMAVMRREDEQQAFDEQFDAQAFANLDQVNEFMEENRNPLIAGHQQQRVAELLNDPRSPLMKNVAEEEKARQQAELTRQWVDNANWSKAKELGVKEDQWADPDFRANWEASNASWFVDAEGKAKENKPSPEERTAARQTFEAKTESERAVEAYRQLEETGEAPEGVVLPDISRRYWEEMKQPDPQPPVADYPETDEAAGAFEISSGQESQFTEQVVSSFRDGESIGEATERILKESDIEWTQQSFLAEYQSVYKAASEVIGEQAKQEFEAMQATADESRLAQFQSVARENEALRERYKDANTQRQLVQQFGTPDKALQAHLMTLGISVQQAKAWQSLIDSGNKRDVPQDVQDMHNILTNAMSSGVAAEESAGRELEAQRNRVRQDVGGLVVFEPGKADPKHVFTDVGLYERYEEEHDLSKKASIIDDSIAQQGRARIDAQRARISESAQSVGQFVAFPDDKSTTPVYFNQNAAGLAAYSAYNEADDQGKQAIVQEYKDHVEDESKKSVWARRQLNLLASGQIEIQQYELIAGGKTFAERYEAVPMEAKFPTDEEEWDAYMQRLASELGGHVELRNEVMNAALKEKETWQKEQAARMGFSGQEAEDIMRRIAGLEGTAYSARAGKVKVGDAEFTGDTRRLIRGPSGEEEGQLARYFTPAGGRQPLVPDERWKRTANSVRIGDQEIPDKEGHVLMWISDSRGRVKVDYVPDNDFDSRQEQGWLPFGR